MPAIVVFLEPTRVTLPIVGGHHIDGKLNPFFYLIAPLGFVYLVQ